MKDFINEIVSSTNIELSVKKKQEIEYVLEGELRTKKGHFIWEINTLNGACKKAEYKSNTIGLTATTEIATQKLIVNQNCIYIPALNAANALSKYNKNKNQSHYYYKAAPFEGLLGKLY